MTKKHWENRPISASDFMHELRRYEKGSISRRHFLGATGLGAATAMLGAAIPARHRTAWIAAFALLQGFVAAMFFTWRPVF